MAGPARTQVDLPPLSDDERTRMKALEHELRCLVCQNQTLADSNAELAGDLRNQVHQLVASGRSDNEIKDYLVARYGDFVLYRPPVQGNTALLWGGPFALLATGAATWLVIQRRQRRAAELDRTARKGTLDTPSTMSPPGSAPVPGTGTPASQATDDDAARQRARDLLN